MRLFVHIILDSGGRFTIEGRDLSAEDVNEIFGIISGKEIESLKQEPESIDDPLPPRVKTDPVCMIPACGCDGTPHP
jgi:hypothetical protein